MPRYNVEFSPEVNRKLEELARRQGGTKADVLRRAIALEEWFDETKQRGGRVLVEEDGQTREVVHLR